MDSYALYSYQFCSVEAVQGDFFLLQDVQFGVSDEDKHLWLDRLFGERKSNVQIQHVKKNVGADTYPCTVLAHKDRVVWLRLENEKAVSIYVKSRHNPTDIDAIKQEFWPSNPYSFIFIDCREGRNLIAIKKDADAWRNTDTIANLLEVSLNAKMESLCYAFRIRIKPETMPRDFMRYNRKLIKIDKRKVRKMVIRFKSGSIDPEVEAKIRRSPILSRLLKEMWLAPSGELILNNPEGSRIVDNRLVDVKRIIELILCLGAHSGFGLSLSYDDGLEVSCGVEVRISYSMEANTLQMLFDESLGSDLFGEYEINKWLDKAANHIIAMKDEKTVDTHRKRKAPKQVRDTSLELDFA